jgi:hypothetical protein
VCGAGGRARGALGWAARAPRGRAIRALAIVTVVPAAMVLPAAVSFLESAAPMLSHVPPIPPTERVSMPGRVSPFHELRIPWPELYLRSVDQPCYPGVVALGVGVAGALAGARAERRSTWAWLALAAWILFLGVGADVALADRDGTVLVSLPGFPRLLKALVPPASTLGGWPRIGCVVGPIAGLVLVTGLERAIVRWPRVRVAVPAIVVAVVADTLTWPMPFELEARTFDPRAPAPLAEIAAAMPPGALVLLPHDVLVQGEGEHDLPAMHQHYVLWRRELGRPITNGYLVRMDSRMDRNLFVAASVALAMDVANGRRAPDALTGPGFPQCARAAARALADEGVAGIVLTRALPYAAELEPALRRWLGPPTRETTGALAWDTAVLPVGTQAACPAPEQLLADLFGPPPAARR